MSFGGGFAAAFQSLKNIEIRKAEVALKKEAKKKQLELIHKLEESLSEDELKLLKKSKSLSRIEENEKSELKCPECDSEFFIVKAGGMEFCGCNKCRSVWLNHEQAESLENSEKIILTKKRYRESNYKCPQCEEDLVECVYKIPGNLLVDICKKNCGMYFEQGEVARAIYLNNKISKVGRW